MVLERRFQKIENPVEGDDQNEQEEVHLLGECPVELVVGGGVERETKMRGKKSPYIYRWRPHSNTSSR